VPERAERVVSTRTHVDSPAEDVARVDASARSEVGIGPNHLQTATVEDALARALSLAAAGQRWDVVAQLARELEARRLARAGNVVPLDTRREKKGGG
jgi:hypothetical protein